MHNEHAAALAEGRIDLAWTVPSTHPGVGSRDITSDELIAAVRPTIRLRRQNASTSDFGNEPLITLAPNVGPLLHDTVIELAMSVIRIPGVVHRPLTTDLNFRQTLLWRLDGYTPLVRSFVETASEVLSTDNICQVAAPLHALVS